MLPINIDDLLNNRGVESARVEFKASWNDAAAGQVLRTICAFANDFHNLNGGYIVIGVAEEDGVAVLPPKGLASQEIDGLQKWVRGHCNRLDPPYQPLISVEVVSGRHIVVIWAPGSDTRPHRAPEEGKKGKRYFVRLGSETVDAEANGLLPDLLQMTANVPFDDRRALNANLADLREAKAREFLNEIRSALVEEHDARELYRKMRISAQVNDHDVPLNIGLLMFSETPEPWFPCARIEVVHFADDASGDLLEERIFRGGLHEQIRQCLRYMENMSHWHLEKQVSKPRVKGWVSYPIQALTEAVVNAVYHRGYEKEREPIKVYLYADRIEIISYPGPVRGLEPEHFRPEVRLPPVPARNRRIGEMLKELRLTEGRGTGLPKVFRAMRENGSPAPRFDFDPERSYFRVTLPAHPEYVAISAMRDAAHLTALGNKAAALRRLEEAWRSQLDSATLAAELIRAYGEKGDITAALNVHDAFKSGSTAGYVPFVTHTLIDVLFEAGRGEQAGKLLNELPSVMSAADACDAAILAKRLGRHEAAHRYFEKAGDALLVDPRGLHEFAQTKIKLAQKVFHGRSRNSRFKKETNAKLLKEARELLERVLQLEADTVRQAWAWRDLARVRGWQKAPRSEIIAAYQKALDLLPEEPLFGKELERWKANRNETRNRA